MPSTATEDLHPMASSLDQRPRGEVAELLAQGQIDAAEAVTCALDAIVAGAQAMATTITQGARLHYVAAGSSGLMAAADALELGGTFSIPPESIRIHMAGGMPTSAEMPGETEDEIDAAGDISSEFGKGDTVIAVSASGTTPYTLALATAAKARGVSLIGIANNPGTPLLLAADHAVLLATPPELVSGSTRMGAGTAQKIALNMLSTMMAVELGHIHDGMMVNLRADNYKLRARARGIVMRIANVSAQVADDALGQTHGDVKSAIVLAALKTSPETARALLAQTNGHLRPALSRTQT